MGYYWQCTYMTNYGFTTTKRCYTSCCETDCCPESSSSSDKTGLVLAVTLPIVVVSFILILSCCLIWRRQRALTRQNANTVPARRVIVTRTAVIRAARAGDRAGASVPQQNGSDKPIFLISTLATPAQTQNEQPPKATV